MYLSDEKEQPQQYSHEEQKHRHVDPPIGVNGLGDLGLHSNSQEVLLSEGLDELGFRRTALCCRQHAHYHIRLSGHTCGEHEKTFLGELVGEVGERVLRVQDTILQDEEGRVIEVSVSIEDRLLDVDRVHRVAAGVSDLDIKEEGVLCMDTDDWALD